MKDIPATKAGLIAEIERLHTRVAELEALDAERRKAEQAFEERITFETLLTEISAKFVNLPVSEVNREVENGLQLIAEFLNVDRISLSEFSEDMRALHITHSYAAPGRKPLTGMMVNEDTPWFTGKLRLGETLVLERLPEDLPAGATLERQHCLKHGIKSTLGLPLKVGESSLGALLFVSLGSRRPWPDNLVKRLRLVGEIFANSLMRKRTEEALHEALLKIKQLKEDIEADYSYLREEIKLEHNFDEIIGQSDALKYVLFQVGQVAPTDATVLVLGETGTGKELIARAIPCGNDTACTIPIAIDAGLGELARNGLLITPGFGPRVRLAKIFTDLPLVPDRPIEFGVQDFCRICKKCAKKCPSQAIMQGEPTAETHNISNREGVMAWHINAEKCLSFWADHGTDCSTCIRVCPFNKPPGKLHDAVRWGINNLRWLDKWFLLGDDLLGYGRQGDPNGFWRT